jgi:hypothetical protein
MWLSINRHRFLYGGETTKGLVGHVLQQAIKQEGVVTGAPITGTMQHWNAYDFLSIG